MTSDIRRPSNPHPHPHSSQHASSHLQYGPPRRIDPRPYPVQLETIENFNNKASVEEYLSTIIKHYNFLESNSSVNPAMIDLQPEVKWYMRPYLVNFIIQMHSSLKLKSQTLYLCWNIIDRYCAKRIAFKQHYQLIGCTALWIASKYEDKKSRVPTVQELSSMCSNVYEESMFKEMEMHILSTLNWSIGHVTLEDILQLSIKFSNHDGRESLTKPLSTRGNSPIVSGILAISRYLCELSLYDRAYLNFKPSLIGITCHLIACSILNVSTGYKSIESIFTSYTMNQLSLQTPTSPNINRNQFNFRSNNNNKKNSNSNSKINHSKKFEFDDEMDDENFGYCEFDDEFEDEDLENEDEFFDSDRENVDPIYQINNGPFISGFHGNETILEIRKIATLIFKSMNKPPEALVEKFTPLGVINAINQYFNENYNSLQNLSSLLSFDDSHLDPLSYFQKGNLTSLDYCYVIELTDLLLSFPDKFEANIYNSLLPRRPRYNSNNYILESPVSATKSTFSFQTPVSNSKFSNANSSPIISSNSISEFSSFSSVSSQTTYSSNEDLTQNNDSVATMNQKSIYTGQSNPYVNSRILKASNNIDYYHNNGNGSRNIDTNNENAKLKYPNSSPIISNSPSNNEKSIPNNDEFITV